MATSTTQTLEDGTTIQFFDDGSTLVTDNEGNVSSSPAPSTSSPTEKPKGVLAWTEPESAVTADEAAAIEKFGLYNLADFLPKKPSEAELRIIKEMFEASVDGEAYDP